jgi:hypothetical protein
MNDWERDPPPGPMAKLMIAACLAFIAVLTTASVVGMTGALDRLHRGHADSDCQIAHQLCDEDDR